jgi:hypothetical protein
MNNTAKTLTDCFQEGANARAKGLKLADNPYSLLADGHAEWAAGWCATFDLDEEDDPASNRDHKSEEEKGD